MQPSITTQVLSSAGAVIILIAYFGHQMKWMQSERPLYNLLNAAGAAVLAYIAFHPLQVGFFVLESSWTAISLYALWRSLRAQPPAS